MYQFLLGMVVFYYLYRWYKEKKRVSDEWEKYVYITGCDSGFGRLLARRLDALGFCVIASCITEKGEEDLKKDCSATLTTVHLDVTKTDSVTKAAELIKTKVGEKGLWGLVNNAGVSVPCGPCDWLTIEDYKSLLDVNLNGVIAVTLSVLPLIKKARGRIVNVASVLGRISLQGGPYSISKFGVEAFNDSIRREMIHFGVKVICIEPGFFRTNMSSSDVIQRQFEKLWAKLPEEIREDYGNDYIDKVFRQKPVLEKMLDDDLMKVVSCMEHALCAVCPRTRYSAGWDSKFLWLPLSYMPSFISDYLLVRKGAKPAKSVI
ncbi:retinol dehydrogenase 7-like isoform X2 [Brienomyrus brachyistius]|nr:retinol dehydrogenase 7-like isoform X2 [Brienomyrus brachyistius]XP_048835559.1 retinol dehydrogenase 7-like isoform X2 [Brienomyrus brachyistius]XP_048835560.1 retinol dehydrogenase 7-like isoform X2 [Brienomyrus brachyistius]